MSREKKRQRDRKKQRVKKIQKTVDYPQNWNISRIYETQKSTQGIGFQRSLITFKLG